MSENELREALLQSEAARERLMGALRELYDAAPEIHPDPRARWGSTCEKARAALSASPSAVLAEREAGLKARIAQLEKERDDARAIERAAARVMLVGTLATYGIEAHDDGNVLHIDSADPLRERLKQEREAERWATATAFDEAFGTCVPLTTGETITADAFRKSRTAHDARVRREALEALRFSVWTEPDVERGYAPQKRLELSGHRFDEYLEEPELLTEWLNKTLRALASTPSETEEPK